MTDRTRSKRGKRGFTRRRKSDKGTKTLAAEPTMTGVLLSTRKEEPYARPITVTKKETRDE